MNLLDIIAYLKDPNRTQQVQGLGGLLDNLITDQDVLQTQGNNGLLGPVGTPKTINQVSNLTPVKSQAEMKPTPQNPMLGSVANLLSKGREVANQYEVQQWVPLLGGTGVGDLLIGKAPEEVTEWSYGNAPMRINHYAGQTASFVPEVKPGRQESFADAVMLGADVLPVAGAAKGAKKIIKATENLPVGASIKPISSAPVTDLGFYSAVEDAALNVQRKSGAGQAFLNDIAKGSNVTKDEIKWIGLEDFLQGKKNVTREEVQQFIAANKVDVQEVALGAPTETQAVAAKRERFQELADKMEREDGLSPQDMAEMDSLQQELSAYPNPWLSSNTKTRYDSYTLPGGENYREILLTLPQKVEKGFMTPNGAFFSEADLADPIVRSTAEKIGLSPAFRNVGDTYRSSHWDQKNVLAHIRVNDRVDADGKKMLLIEEVQSDWHQAGRDKGYDTPEKRAADQQKLNDIVAERQRLLEEQKRIEELAKPYTSEGKDAPANLIDQWSIVSNKLNALQTAQNRLGQNFGKTGVPDAPMKDTWYQLALKRVLKYAADNGYERIGLTTGSRQAERYDLSKQIDAVTWIPKGDGIYDFEVIKDGATIISKRDADASWLKDNIGKELAQKVVDDQHTDILERSGRRFIEGNDLTVGGEGMKKYYDEVYPKFLEKYGKKWGAKVGETRIETEQSPKSWAYFRDWFAANHSDVGGSSTALAQWESGEKSKYVREFLKQNKAQEPVRFVDITPEMRESVKKGQPMFVAAPLLPLGATSLLQEEEKQKKSLLD